MTARVANTVGRCSRPPLWLLLILATSSLHADGTNATGASVDYKLRVKDRPLIQRGFLPDSSPRSIAVGLPGGLSYCFDAESCRLRYAWSGGFLDMKPTWHGRGAAPPELRGAKFFVAPDMMPLRVGDRTAAPNVKFLGYALAYGLPEFRFTVDGVAVKERIEAATGGGLRCAFELGEAKREIWFHLPRGVRASGAERDLASDAEGWVRIRPGAPRNFEVWIPGPANIGPVKTATPTSNER